MSPKELWDLSELAAAVKILNEESDDINATLKSVNARLGALNIGFEVWEGPWERAHVPHQIGFAKVGERWELAVRTCQAARNVDQFGWETYDAVAGSYGDARSILQAPRNVRIDALTVLPDIICDLESEIHSSLDVIRKGKEIAADLESPKAPKAKSQKAKSQKAVSGTVVM
jgi:hypothetical protein